MDHLRIIIWVENAVEVCFKMKNVFILCEKEKKSLCRKRHLKVESFSTYTYMVGKGTVVEEKKCVDVGFLWPLSCRLLF